MVHVGTAAAGESPPPLLAAESSDIFSENAHFLPTTLVAIVLKTSRDLEGTE
jgi:hypothetical protein